jgi:DNA-binding CsgD family transcriptional regulator/PAS domain-containing protein
MDAVTWDRTSHLMGAIYDCVIEPDRWPLSMEKICAELGCIMSSILLVDLEHSKHRFFKHWNLDPYWRVKNEEYYTDMTELYRNAPPAPTHVLDEPLVLSRDIPESILSSTRFYQEWVKPQGICDSPQASVLRNAAQIGVFSAIRHESRGIATDREISLLRLLAPHIRRAVTISDLMDLKTLEGQALAATLDNFAVGVIIVAEGHRILHANDAARAMFAAGSPVCSVNGRLSVRGSDGACELAKAIVLAQQNEATIGATGIGVALGDAGEPAIAHVLPLARGDLRTRLMPQATAAVFVTHAELAPPAAIAALAANFKLTPAETRMFERLAAGATLAEAAEILAIAETTARTHLSRILSKTGVARQAGLVALIHRLSPPVRQPG